VVWGLAAPAQAQVAEEIIVTAQKREQAMQDVGISMTAMTGDMLEELGLTQTEDLALQTPGLTFSGYGGGVTTVFTIRGSGQLNFSDAYEPPVAVIQDGAYNSFIGGVGNSFFDLERVEVLRGPQSTLFGRNATGGVIQLISRRPDEEASFGASLTAGSFGLLRGEAAIGGALAPDLAARASLYFEQDDGYMEDRNGPDLNNTDNFSGRVQLLYEPSPTFSAHIVGRWSIDETRTQGYVTEPGAVLANGSVVANPSQADFDSFCTGLVGGVAPVGSSTCFGHVEPDDDPFTLATDRRGSFEREHYGLTGTLEWDLGGGVSLTSVTDYQDFQKAYLNEDSDGTPLDLFTFDQSQDSSQLSQELRLQGDGDNTRWTAGAYYLNIDSSFDVDNGLTFVPVFFGGTAEQETTTWAVFGQVEHDFSDRITGIAGLRWTTDEKDATIISTVDQIPNAVPCAPADVVQFCGPISQNRSEDQWSGLLELDFHATDDLLFYLKASRGVKAGGFNVNSIFFLNANELEFDGETLDAIEGGFKSTFWEGRGRFNAAVFSYDYQDFQTFTVQGASTQVFNIDAENLGAELELALSPTDGLDISLGVATQDARQLALTHPFGGTRDRPMPNAPDLTINGLVRYEWPMLTGAASVQFDVTHSEERTLDAIDNPAAFSPSYTLVNGTIGWEREDGRVGIDVWGRNLGDEEIVNFYADTSTIFGGIIYGYAPPRTYGVTLRVDF
jgi:iron complex outermembrane receptor protein